MSDCNKPLNLCKNNNYPHEKFWMDDIKELYQNNNYLKFFPKYEMTRTEQINSITRFSLYFIILILLFDREIEWLYIPITIIVLGVIFYNIHVSDKDQDDKKVERIMNIRKNQIINELKKDKIDLVHDGDIEYKLDIDNVNNNNTDKPYEIQSGFYDSDGVLRIGPKNDIASYYSSYPSHQDSLLTMDEIIDHQKSTCRRPTVDNPFMNPYITDYNNGDPPAACNADDEEIKDEMTVNFNHELFRDVDELWERENSQRQFYTIPTTAIPNNQVEFAKWLYYIPKTCKEDQNNCLRYEDLRFKHNPYTV